MERSASPIAGEPGRSTHSEHVSETAAAICRGGSSDTLTCRISIVRAVRATIGLALVAAVFGFVLQYRVGNLALLAQWAGGRDVTRGRRLMGRVLAGGGGLRLGDTYGPWTMSDSAGAAHVVPVMDRSTVILALGPCTSCAQQDLASFFQLAGAYPEAAWIAVTPQADPWLALYPSAAERITFTESPDLKWHKRLGAAFLPRAYLFDGQRRLLYIQSAEAKLRPEALMSVREILQGLRDNRRADSGVPWGIQ